MGSLNKTSYSRVWVIQHRAGPAHVPTYEGLAKAGAIDHALGDVTPIRVPSSTQYGHFDEVEVIRGAEDRPTLSLMNRMLLDDVSYFGKLVKLGCPSDLQIHFGKCTNPTDFNGGWEKIIAFENASATNYSTPDLGAFEPGEDAVIDETIDFTGEWFYEIIKMNYAERAQTVVGQEIVSVSVCDTGACGDCESPSDGCQKVFAVSAPSPSSPGVKAEVIFTDDGFVTAEDTWITTLDIGQDPDDAECVASNLVVVSTDSLSLHYADTADILNGVEAWAEVATGFVAAKGPTCITKANSNNVWIGGVGGYIYFSEDPTQGVTVQDAGSTTTQTINDIHAFSTEIVVAGAAAGIFLYTLDGEAWQQSYVKPDPVHSPSITAVYALSERVWFAGTADGALWYTENQGITWTQVRFYGDTSGGGGTVTVRDIVFATKMVGFMATSTAVPAGRIFRTIDGGHSWYVAPESGTVPAHDYMNKLAVCNKNANVVYAGGLADSAADGIIIKGS